MKVLHVINSLTPGGAETLLVNSLAKGGLQNHYNNEVAYFMGTSSLQQRIDKDVKIHTLNYKGYTDIFGVLRRLRKIITSRNINLVHSHLNPAGVYTHLICPRNIPQVHTLHTTYSMDTMTDPSKMWMERNFFFKHKSANLIFLSNYIKNDFLNCINFKGNAFILNNFVHDDFFSLPAYKDGQNENVFKLIAIGNLNPVKNHKYLIEIFEYLKDYNIELDIYGGGDIELFNKIILNKAVKITMKGFAEDISKVLTKYNLFIMPSHFEGFPLSLFEAMAAGLPCMVSDIKPLKEIAADNVIYFKLDNAESTALQIKELSNNSSFLHELGAKAKKHAAATASRDKYITNLSSIYNQVLNR